MRVGKRRGWTLTLVRFSRTFFVRCYFTSTNTAANVAAVVVCFVCLLLLLFPLPSYFTRHSTSHFSSPLFPPFPLIYFLCDLRFPATNAMTANEQWQSANITSSWCDAQTRRRFGVSSSFSVLLPAFACCFCCCCFLVRARGWKGSTLSSSTQSLSVS